MSTIKTVLLDRPVPQQAVALPRRVARPALVTRLLRLGQEEPGPMLLPLRLANGMTSICRALPRSVRPPSGLRRLLAVTIRRALKLRVDHRVRVLACRV